MNDKKYFFMVGTARSGSTLLSALLNQHPSIHCSNTSPVPDLMVNCEAFLTTQNENFRVTPDYDALQNVISSFLPAYYKHINKPVIVDKNRAWVVPDFYNSLCKYVDKEPKFICVVRPVLDMLASFLKLVHRHPDRQTYIDDSLTRSGLKINDENRCLYLMEQSMTGKEIYALNSMFAKLPRQNSIIIPYKTLVKDTQNTLSKVFNFLNLPDHVCDLENIKLKTEYNDDFFGIPDMHTVKKQIIPSTTDYTKVLPKNIINKYKSLDFWDMSPKTFLL